MNSAWITFLFPPKISNYEQGQRARLLHYMLIAVFIGALVNGISNYLNGWVIETYVLSILTLVCLVGFYLNHTRQYYIAAWIFCVSFYVVISLLLYHGAGLYDSTILAFPIFLICTAFLFGTRGLVTGAIFSILAIFTIYILQINGLFESAYKASLLRAVIISLFFAIISSSRNGLNMVYLALTKETKPPCSNLSLKITESCDLNKC